MDIIEAVSQRKSIRAFKSDPPPLDALKKIVELALQAPSWANSQPWYLAVVSGRELEEIRKGFIEKSKDDPASDIARPKEFPDPHGTRRADFSAKLLEAKGIQREDKERRHWWRLQGLGYFGAPCVIYVCINRSFYFQGDGVNAWSIFDCGLVAENIMTLALNYGLGTIPLAEASAYPDIVRKVLGLPDSKLIVMGIAIGYPDWNDQINQFNSERDPLDKITKWYGFD